MESKTLLKSKDLMSKIENVMSNEYIVQNFWGIRHLATCDVCVAAKSARRKKDEDKKQLNACKLFGRDDFWKFLNDQHGVCKYCKKTELTVPDPLLPRQPISAFIPIYDLAGSRTNCKTAVNIKYLFCGACATIIQSCGYDKDTCERYRSNWFVHDGKKKQTYHGTHWERLDHIHLPVDHKSGFRWASIAFNKPPIGLGIKKNQVYAQWLKQEGFVMLPLPPSLQTQVLQDRVDSEMDDFQSERKDERTNPTLSVSLNLVDDKDLEFSRKTIGRKPKEDEDNENEDEEEQDDEEPESDDKTEEKGVQDATTTTPRVKKLRKIRGTVSIAPSDLFSSRSDVVRFWIPIDPRRSVANRGGLTSLQYVPLDPRAALSSDNMLLTCKMLTTIQEKYEYLEFIKWCLSTLPRAKKPTFQPLLVQKTESTGLQEVKTLVQELKKYYDQEDDLKKQVTPAKTALAKISKEKKVISKKCLQTLIRAVEMDEDVSFLSDYKMQLVSKKPRGATSNKKKGAALTKKGLAALSYSSRLDPKLVRKVLDGMISDSTCTMFVADEKVRKRELDKFVLECSKKQVEVDKLVPAGEEAAKNAAPRFELRRITNSKSKKSGSTKGKKRKASDKGGSEKGAKRAKIV